MLRPIFLAILEVKRFLSDRGDLAFSIALPIALFALMYGAFGGDQQFSSTAHVVDLDQGPAARDLLDRLEAVDVLTVQLHDEAEAAEELDRSRILSAIVIPLGFSESLAAGRPVTLTFRQRGSGGDEGQIVANIVRGVAQDLAAEYQVRHAVRGLMADTALPESVVSEVIEGQLARAAGGPPVLVAVGAAEEEADFVRLLMPGIVTMFLLFSVTLAAQSLVMERHNGTLERLLTTRLGVNQLFLGKFLGGVGRAMLQAIVLLGLAFVVLNMGGVPEFVQMLAFAAIVSGAVSGVGMLLAALARTRDQGTWMAVFFTMLMTIFGATFFQPADGSLMDTLSAFTINKHANEGFRAILVDGHIGQAGIEIAILAVVMLASLAAARWAFRVSGAAP